MKLHFFNLTSLKIQCASFFIAFTRNLGQMNTFVSSLFFQLDKRKGVYHSHEKLLLFWLWFSKCTNQKIKGRKSNYCIVQTAIVAACIVYRNCYVRIKKDVLFPKNTKKNQIRNFSDKLNESVKVLPV